MSINQLKDDGAVIGYRPTLQYKKEIKSDIAEGTKKSSATDYSGKVKYSETINSFNNNLPSTSLKNIDYALENMKLLIDKLALSFQNGNWNQYGEVSSLLSAIESKDDEYITNFIEYHKENITGSIVPELIGAIYDTEERLKILSDVLKELYYGESTLTTEEANQIDKAYIEKIKSYEASGDISKINYLTLSYDAVLNRSVSMYAFGANEQAIDIADVVTISENTTANASKDSFIQKLFKEVNQDIDYRQTMYKEQQSVEIMQKTLYNYYDKRQEMIELYDLLNTNENSIFIGQRVQNYQQQLDNAITNVNRSFAGNKYFLSEIAKLEREKNFLKNIYANLNYNSDN